MANFKVWILVGILFATVVKTQGLQCYHCMYNEGATRNRDLVDLNLPIDESCKQGQTPASSFLQDCLEVFTSEGMKGLIPTRDWNTLNHTCAKFTFEGRSQGKALRTTVRSCMPTTQTETLIFKESCSHGLLGDVIDHPEGVRDDFDTSLANLFEMVKLEPKTKTNVCTCNGDNCNSAIGIAPGATLIIALVGSVVFGYLKMINL